MKKLLNKIKELYKKSSLFRIIIILLIWALIIFEWKNIYVDRYNFQQLEKAKKVVENLKWEQKLYRARGLKDFNYQFDTDIKPLDKRYCYDVYYDTNPTWPWYVFTFWFKLHSLLYKLMYWWEYYIYPWWIITEPETTEECKKEMELSKWRYTGMPACVWWDYYYDYMEAVNNPCER